MSEALRVSSEDLGTMVVVRVDGELDHQTAPDLVAALETWRSTDRPTVIDLTQCTFLDSGGSRAIGISARDGSGDAFGVVCPPENRRVMKVLELVGLTDLLDIRPAVACFSEPG